jgi:hypothetical protein
MLRMGVLCHGTDSVKFRTDTPLVKHSLTFP